MLVAQKKYNSPYSSREHEHLIRERKKENLVVTTKKNKIKAAHKLKLMFSIIFIAAMCLSMLLGYVSLTETKYRVYTLEKEIQKLEGQIQNLKVQTETYKKSTIIEEKAIGELGMQYPTKDQMVFLNIEYNSSTDTKNAEENVEMTKVKERRELTVGIRKVVDNIISLLD